MQRMTIAEKYDVEEYPTRFSNRAAIQDKTFKDGSPYVSIRLDAGPHEDYITPTAGEAADFRTCWKSRLKFTGNMSNTLYW